MRYYYCADGENVIGPLEQTALSALLTARVITPATPVMLEGQTTWGTAQNFITAHHTPPPMPAPEQPQEHIYFNQHGISITSRRIMIGTLTLPTANIGSVNITREQPRILLPLLGFFLFAFFTIGVFATWSESSIILLIVFLPLTIWCGSRAFASPPYQLELSAPGGVQKAYATKNHQLIAQVAAAINNAIIERK